MSQPTTFADLLRQYMHEKHWSLERLALSSGVSKKTIHNWLKPSGVRRPHTWQSLLQIAQTLGLDKSEVNALLQSARHPTLPQLLSQPHSAQDRALLQPWARSTPHNLPSPATSLLGRAAELTALSELLQPQSSAARLVLLTGPGGSGKTQLGLHTARQLLDHFRDGVFFVDLAAIRDPELVLSTIATVLGVTEIVHATLLDSLKQHLRERQLLLLLDNFEQVLPAAPLITELLAAAPELRVLVTSRVVLRLSGEHEFDVAPLATPDPALLPPLPQLAQSPAVALFLERVQAVRPGFRLTDANARAVAEICARLDGLPLAIELAAARIKLLSPETLLARLSESALRLLDAGPRDRPARHQTLQDTIGWSYRLLAPAEQRLFARLSAFCGCTLDMAEAVCAELGTPPGDTLSGLAALLDNSLIYQHQGGDGQTRFVLLATIREFAQAQLEQLDEAAAVHRAHARAYAALVTTAAGQLCGPEQQHWLRGLKAEHDNLRAALGWTLTAGEQTLALQLGAALWGFWVIHGHFSEGRQWLRQILALNPPQGPLWADAIQASGDLAARQGDYAQAQQCFDLALDYWQHEEQPDQIAAVLHQLGSLARQQGDYQRAAELHQHGLELERACGNRRGVVHALMRLGRTAIEQGDHERAQQFFDQAIALDDEPNDVLGLAVLLRNLGDVAYLHGDYARADDLWQQTLTLHEQLEDRQGRAQTHWCLGRAALGLGELGRAGYQFSTSLRLARELADKRGIVDGLAGLSLVLLRAGQPLPAARLAGAQEALRESMAGLPRAATQRLLEQALDQARAEVDQLAWIAAWQAGRAVPIEQLIAELGAARPWEQPALSTAP